MSDLINKLVKSDVKLEGFKNNNKQIIAQGLAPLLAQSHQSMMVLKADLFEQAKLKNWLNKANILFRLLHKNNIKFLVIKGFAYTFTLYNKSHLRPYSDIDVLIRKSDYDAVSSILAELNLMCFSSRQGEFISFQNSFYDKNQPQTVIDLHWQISNRIEIHDKFIFDDLYDKAIRLSAKGTHFFTLDHINAFIYACFHHQAHRPEDRKHIWLYDLGMMWNLMNKDQKQSCLNQTIQLQLDSVVANSLIQLKATFNEALEMEDLGAFEQFISQIDDETTSHYVQQRLTKFNDIKMRLKNITGYKNKLRYLCEYIFQSRNYVQNRYNLKSSKLIFMYYPRMWFEDMVKLFRKY